MHRYCRSDLIALQVNTFCFHHMRLLKGFTPHKVIESEQQLRPGTLVESVAAVAQTMDDWYEARLLDGLNIYIDQPRQFGRSTEELIPLP